MGIEGIDQLKPEDDSGLVICDLKDKPHRQASHINVIGREGIPHCVNPKPAG